MKVLLVHNFYRQAGGEDAVVKHEEALLRAHGVEVHVHAVNNWDIRTLWDRMLTGLRTTYNPAAKRRLAEVIRELRPDVVHVHNFFPLLSPSVFDAISASGAASVFTLHNFRILCPTAFLYYDDQVRERSLHHSSWWTVPRRVYRKSFLGTFAVACMVEWHKHRRTWRRKVDRFIALTPYAKTKFVEGGLPGERIAVKGNSVAYDDAQQGGAQTRKGALFVGRLGVEKGLSVLLEAWRGLDYPLTVVGDGPMAGQVDRAGAQVTAVGRLGSDEVRRLMRSAAFLVLPSVWHEMFPLVVIEAMAAGLPVIVSRLEGITSIVTEGETGLCFERGDARSLRQAVEWAMANPDRLAKIGANAREAYLSRHTPTHNYTALMDIYRDAIAQAERRQA